VREDVEAILRYLLTLEREVCAAGVALGVKPGNCPE
jgi:hypothetical protein